MRKIPMAKTVGARELKTRLGTYLREVRRGRTIVVTERGEPVAELRPLELATKGVEAQLDRLVALGLVSRSSRVPLRRFRPIRHRGRPLSETIADDRGDRF
jgi:prevent-host-death family protein